MSMRDWADLEGDEPPIAAAGRRLLEDDPGVPGVAFLATVSGSGRPRMHPFIPAVVDGRLWAFVIVSPKQRDLERGGQYAIHALLGADDEQFLVSGVSERVDDLEARELIAASMPYDDVDDRHILYRFGIDRALWTTWETPTSPTHHAWVARSG
jgi:hypothetical protein